MMFFQKRSCKQSQPFLLIWLLPLLFWSVAADGLHNHPLFELDGASRSVQSAAPSAPTHHAPAVEAAAPIAAHADCLAHQWQSHSAANLDAPLTISAGNALASSFVRPVVLFSSPFFGSRAIRGPPLS